MNNQELRNYIKGYKKIIKNRESSTEVLVNIKKEIEEILDAMKVTPATLVFLHNIKKTLNISIKKSKRKENLDLNYFDNPNILPSPAEVLIINSLNKLKVRYLREVSFEGFKSPKDQYYRFDFYIPDHNMIIEYDGKAYHLDKTNDYIKNKFCLNNKIKLVRLDAKHYYKLDKEIKKLLK